MLGDPRRQNPCQWVKVREVSLLPDESGPEAIRLGHGQEGIHAMGRGTIETQIRFGAQVEWGVLHMRSWVWNRGHLYRQVLGDSSGRSVMAILVIRLSQNHRACVQVTSEWCVI